MSFEDCGKGREKESTYWEENELKDGQRRAETE